MNHYLHTLNELQQLPADVKPIYINTAPNSKNELIRDYQRALEAPHGSLTWDSLDEIMSDLTWFHEKKLCIIIENTPNVPKEDLYIFLWILEDNAKGGSPIEETQDSGFIKFFVPDKILTILDSQEYKDWVKTKRMIVNDESNK